MSVRRIVRPKCQSLRTRSSCNQSFRAVWIGGGGGSAALLRALWKISPRIAAIICVSDNGTDSGKLRQGLGWAPGDIRRALVALAADPKAELAQLLGVRFDERFPERTGQSFGNSVFAAAALCGLDMADQIKMVARLLGVTGTVYPATFESVGLVGELTDGSIICGETAVAECGPSLHRVRLDPEGAAPPIESRDALRLADAIIIGPGSVATSLIPAMIPSATAIAESDAARFLIIPAFIEGGFDHGYSAADYVRFIAGHFSNQRMFDCVLCHQHTPGELANSAGQRPVATDLSAIRALGYAAVGADLLAEDGSHHDGERVAALVADLCSQFSRQCPAVTRVRQERIKSIRYA